MSQLKYGNYNVYYRKQLDRISSEWQQVTIQLLAIFTAEPNFSQTKSHMNRYPAVNFTVISMLQISSTTLKKHCQHMWLL